MSDPETLTDFPSVLAAVTGMRVDLRSAASPAGGWITFGGTGWWTYAPFGSPLFTVGLNVQALADWASAVSGLDGVADELAAGTLGLMDVRRLWDAEQTVRLHTDHLSSASGDMRTASLSFGGSDSPISGSATEEISTQVSLLASYLSSCYDTLGGPPPIADAIHDAGQALAAFGQGMAGAYRESALRNAASDGVNGLAANIQNYLAQQPVTTDTVAQVLAGYSSLAGGALPTGMNDLGGDLTQSSVWNAASSAITSRIVAELDQLDAKARVLAHALDRAYQTAAARLNSVVAGGHQRQASKSVKRLNKEPLPTQSYQRVQGKMPLQALQRVQGKMPLQALQRVQGKQLGPMESGRVTQEPLVPMESGRVTQEPFAPVTPFGESVPDSWSGQELQQNFEPATPLSEPLTSFREPLKSLAEPMGSLSEPLSSFSEPLSSLSEPLTPLGESVPVSQSESAWQEPVGQGIEDSVPPEGTLEPGPGQQYTRPSTWNSATPADQ